MDRGKLPFVDGPRGTVGPVLDDDEVGWGRSRMPAGLPSACPLLGDGGGSLADADGWSGLLLSANVGLGGGGGTAEVLRFQNLNEGEAGEGEEGRAKEEADGAGEGGVEDDRSRGVGRLKTILGRGSAREREGKRGRKGEERWKRVEERKGRRQSSDSCTRLLLILDATRLFLFAN